MPPRQLWMFAFGCWATIGTAVLHLAGHLAGPMTATSDAERQVLELATSYRFLLPGGTTRSFMDFVDGFSLTFALQLAMMGAVGVIVQKRAKDDRALMTAVARAFAVASVALLAISLAKFFIIPTLCLAVMATCFLVASVEAPQAP